MQAPPGPICQGGQEPPSHWHSPDILRPRIAARTDQRLRCDRGAAGRTGPVAAKLAAIAERGIVRAVARRRWRSRNGAACGGDLPIGSGFPDPSENCRPAPIAPLTTSESDRSHGCGIARTECRPPARNVQCASSASGERRGRAHLAADVGEIGLLPLAPDPHEGRARHRSKAHCPLSHSGLTRRMSTMPVAWLLSAVARSLRGAMR